MNIAHGRQPGAARGGAADPAAAASGGIGGAAPIFIELTGEAGDAAAELRGSLSAARPWIAPKFFYDRLGSALFGAICELPEYYPTRTEASIFEIAMPAISSAIKAQLGGRATLIDLGAGDCAKGARMFEPMDVGQYVAVDISSDYLREALTRAAHEHPGVTMIGIGVDFSRPFHLPAAVAREHRVFFYAGSSIGNFTPREAVDFLRVLRGSIVADGGLLIGVDLVKSASQLETAYDDALGVTAAFNLNMLRNVNQVIGGDFNPLDWRHRAIWNAQDSRIEMHLVARRALRANWSGGGRAFAAGESIHTENSYKYSVDGFERLLRAGGFVPAASWRDPGDLFGVFWATPGPT